jgi:hypothetical protein
MAKSSREIITEMLKEGHRAVAIKSELTARGLDTKDFYDEYYKIIDDLGIKETNHISGPSDYAEAYEVSKARKAGHHLDWLNSLVKVVLILAVVGVVVWLIITGSWRMFLGEKIVGNGDSQSGLSATDIKYEVTLKKTAQTARIYKNKILDYGGLCKSIGLEDIYRCAENRDNYAIEVRLSNGYYYCIDGTGFDGIAKASFGKGFQCLP